jgi:hypothetical protein
MNSGGAIDPTTMNYYFNDGLKYIGVSFSSGLVESSCTESFESGEQFVLFRNNTNCVGASFIRENPLNIKALSSSDFKVYPNPSFGHFSIQSSNEPLQTINITSIDGQIIQQQKFNNSLDKTVEINGLSQGVYFVIINNRNFQKIVVN